MTYKLPEGWKEVKLKDIATFNKNNYRKNDNWNFVNYLDTGNITNGIIDEIRYIDLESEKLPSRARRKVIKWDVIYSTGFDVPSLATMYVYKPMKSHNLM